ncbi:hypothetical protein ACFX13_025738 [Malus domestica]
MDFFNWTSTWIPSSEWPSSVLTNQNPSTHFSAENSESNPQSNPSYLVHQESQFQTPKRCWFASGDGELIHAVHDMFLGVDANTNSQAQIAVP